ncbi:MAG: YHS domain-containing protein, partial [Pseudomonadota bacterium]
MRRFKTIATIGFVSAALAFSLPTFQAHATDPVYTGTFSDLAVDGHDPVAYFTDGKPVDGSSDHELEWNGATWRFSSAANLASFKADPE